MKSDNSECQIVMSKGPKVPQTLKISHLTDSPALPMTQASPAMAKLGSAIEDMPHMTPGQQLAV